MVWCRWYHQRYHERGLVVSTYKRQMLELYGGTSETRPMKKLFIKKQPAIEQKLSVLDNLISEIDSMESTQLRKEAGKDSSNGGYGL